MKTLSLGAVCAFTTIFAGVAIAQDRLPAGVQPLPGGRLPAEAMPRGLTPWTPARC